MKKIIIAMALLTSCQRIIPINDQLERHGILFANRMEATPIVFNGKIINVVSNRRVVGQEKIEIYDGTNLIHEIMTGTIYISAYVKNDVLFVFSTRNANQIEVISTTDLVNFTQPLVAIQAPIGTEFFNTSVSHDDDGFVMAYETCEPNTTCYNVRFAKSQDLINWVHVGTIYSPHKYAACPTIRFLNGWYYVFVLKVIGDNYLTYVIRTHDFKTFFEGPPVLAPVGDENINTSDMDLVEFGGKVIIQYADGNQVTDPCNIRKAVFNGTLKEFLNKLF